MNESVKTPKDFKNERREKTQKQMTQGMLSNQNNMILAIVGAIIFGFVYSFALTAGYHLLNLTLALLVGLVILDILIIKSKDYDIKNLIFWNIIIIVFSSVFYRTSISYYVVMASIAYPTLLVSLILFSTKRTQLTTRRFIGQHFAFFAHLDYIFKAISITKRKKPDTRKTSVNILIGVVISAFALLIILPLMADADIFFRNSMSNFFDYFENIYIGEFIWKLILGAFFTICGFGFIYTGFVKKYDASKNVKLFHINQVIITTVLTIIGFSYLFFIFTQVNHLFVTKPASTLQGANFAEYARSGFFEMVWLSTINIIIILGCILFTCNKNQYNKILKTLMMYFNTVNLYLLVVSFYKMYLYQSEFGFTEKRSLVYIYIIFQLIVLCLLAVKIFNSDFKFWIIFLYFSCIFWGTVSFINIQNLSFELNVNRYIKTGEIDTHLSGYCHKSANNAIKNFYFEYKDELSDEHLENIVQYFSATYGYEYKEFICNKQKITDHIEERFKNMEFLEVNIQNSLFAQNAETVLLDYHNEFVANK